MERFQVEPGVFLTSDDLLTTDDPQVMYKIIQFKELIDNELKQLCCLSDVFVEEKKDIIGIEPLNHTPEQLDDLTAHRMEFIEKNPVIDELMKMDVYSIPAFMYGDKMSLDQVLLMIWSSSGATTSTTSLLNELQEKTHSLYISPDVRDNFELSDIFLYKSTDGYALTEIKRLYVIEDVINAHSKFINEIHRDGVFGFSAGDLFLYQKLFQI